jgi:hypothetical protein
VQPLDVVYTWVNYGDADWRRSYERFLEPTRGRADVDQAGNASIRFRDNGELRYSLRSLERYAKFVRRIFVVVDGKPPAWLKTDGPDLSVVGHDEIFPGGFPRPAFSSDLIEACLWRIPDLADRYVYFNDDVCLSAECRPDDFFGGAGRSIVRMKPDLIYVPRDPADRTFNSMLRNTDRAVRRRIASPYRARFETKRPWVPMIARRLLQNRLSLNATAHIAQPFHKSLWPRFHEVFAAELSELAACRVRHERGFCVNLAYQYFAESQGLAEFRFDSSDLLISPAVARRYSSAGFDVARAVAARGVKFLCFNDGLAAPGFDWSEFVEQTLSRMFDTPSRWEVSHVEAASRTGGK